MDNWRDLSALHGLLCSAYKNYPVAEERRAAFVGSLKKVLGFTDAQAELYTSTVLSQNQEGSADAVMTNGTRITGTWILSEQEGNVGSWQSTMRETWLFNIDLTYEHKIERYDSSITTGPFFQSSYSRPKMSLQRGIWAPSDNTLDQLRLFVMSTDGNARPMMFEWVEKERYNYRACTINMQRFVRE
jgi:hypothetical protein